MKRLLPLVGTRSLLFGIHQFIWHPIVVYKAWVYLYGRPTWKETVCIIIHDWGYWGKPELDGPLGVDHPMKGALLAEKWFGDEYWMLCAGHSRSYIALMNKRWGMKHGIPKYYVSKLCWADKLSFCFEPRWFYIFRAKLSGEWGLVYAESIKSGVMKDSEHISPKEWYKRMYIYCRYQQEINDILGNRESTNDFLWKKELKL